MATKHGYAHWEVQWKLRLSRGAKHRSLHVVTLSHDKEVPESRQSYLALLQRLFTLTDVDVRRKTNEHTYV
jgi:hypothetical protein